MIDNNQYQGLTEALKLKSTLQQLEGGVYHADDLMGKSMSFEPLELYEKHNKKIRIPGPPEKRSLGLFNEVGKAFAHNRIHGKDRMLMADREAHRGDVMEFRDAKNESVFGIVQKIDEKTGKMIVETVSYDQVDKLLESNPNMEIYLLTDAHSRPITFLNELAKKAWMTDLEGNVVFKYLIGLWLPKLEVDASLEDYILAYAKILLWVLVVGCLLYGLIYML